MFVCLNMYARSNLNVRIFVSMSRAHHEYTNKFRVVQRATMLRPAISFIRMLAVSGRILTLLGWKSAAVLCRVLKLATVAVQMCKTKSLNHVIDFISTVWSSSISTEKNFYYGCIL
jgi:hypothetical protein